LAIWHVLTETEQVQVVVEPGLGKRSIQNLLTRGPRLVHRGEEERSPGPPDSELPFDGRRAGTLDGEEAIQVGQADKNWRPNLRPAAPP